MSRSAALDLVLSSRRVVHDGSIGPAGVGIRDGRIVAIDRPGRIGGDANVDLGDLVLLPGLVDSHVHFNEPGNTDWEGFASGSAAALAGGVTTVIDMPLNSLPVTTSLDALRAKAKAATTLSHADFGLWAGLVPGNAGDLSALIDAGALGAKAFLCPSGLEAFPAARPADLEAAAPLLAALGAPLLVHAEDPEVLDEAAAGARLTEQPRSFARFLASRPPAAERRAVEGLIALARRSGCRIHVVHVASADCLPLLRAARAEGLPISAESCPHYLTLAAEEIGDGETLCKCAPPIREAAHREALWEALRDGTLDLVASDHSPCPPALRALDTGSFAAAWGGIAGLQLGLPLVWSQARRRGFDLTDVARWMSSGPARLAGLSGRKGSLTVGADADLVVFDPDAAFRVRAADLLQRHGATPYEGRELHGRVLSTYLRGSCVYDRGVVIGPPMGQPLREVR